MDSSFDRVTTSGDFFKFFGREDPFWFIAFDIFYNARLEGPCCPYEYQRLNGRTIVHYNIFRGGSIFTRHELLNEILLNGVFVTEADAMQHISKISYKVAINS